MSGFTWPMRKLGRGITWISRFVIPPYFRNAGKELKRVTWLSARQSRQLTSAVIIFAIVFGLIVAGVDYGLDKAFKAVFLR
jgi:preprotein translocase SecE subunit